MNDITTDIQAHNEGTNLRNFLTKRGAIIIKEVRFIGTASGEFGALLQIDTVVLRIIRGTEQTDAFGALLTLKRKDTETTEQVHLDFDEIEELIKALAVIRHTAEEIGSKETDYTEVLYSTKDDAKFGFFQANSIQTGFVGIGYKGTLYQQVQDNTQTEGLLRGAVEHLRTKGAEVDRG